MIDSEKVSISVEVNAVDVARTVADLTECAEVLQALVPEPIDWFRVAEPQADGYDVRVMFGQLLTGFYSTKPVRELPAISAPIWVDGRARFIRMEDQQAPSPELFGMPWDHPNVLAGLALLELWPEIKPLCLLMVALCPLTVGRPQMGHGCTCGNYGDDWGWIYVSADSPWGLAEGIVHEMNHWKLRAFGMWFEQWTDLLLANAPSELYESPVRKDIARPMGAVIHAQYSYIAVAEMCVRMLAAEKAPTSSDVEWTALQLRRITEGQGTIRLHARGTPEVGTQFLAGMDAWTSRVIAEGTALVTRLGGTV